MLRYEAIHEVSGARRRLKKGQDRYSYRYDGRTRDNDQLSLFTFESAALADSAHNLDFLMAQARGHDQRYVVLTDTRVQIAGEPDTEPVADAIAPRAWLRDFAEWQEAHHGPGAPTEDHSRLGSVVTLQSWRHCFCLPEHQGVYDVTTGQRMTRREDIIRAFWSLGFATWRGRPYSIARLRWSGEREELEELTALADRHWRRRNLSDVAKKIVTAHRSINRYAAWPGSW